jgi:hypothetical protein
MTVGRPDLDPHAEPRSIRVRPAGRWTTFADVVAGLRARWERGELLEQVTAASAWRQVVVPLRTPSAGELSDEYAAAQEWVEDWRRRDGRIRLEWASLGGRLIGVNSIPRRAWVDSPDAAWSLLGVTAQARRFTQIVRDAEDPGLAAWAAANPLKVLAHEDRWDRLVDVVRWFRDVARPGTYLRHIDVPGVDTKFVETHRGVLAELLDACLPAERIAPEHPRGDFESRYRLAGKPARIRLRRLDGAGLFPQLPGLSDLSLRADELPRAPVPCRTVFVIENEISFLAFPPVPDAVAVFGGGYAVSLLSGIGWLAERDLVYWGDIDTHGFVMLDRLRASFPNARSLLMDRRTFLDHEAHWGREHTQVNSVLTHLTADEQRLYEDLLEATFGPDLRLEQERVGFHAVRAALAIASTP